ncbi:hypothetical protein L226DRAFT_537064 [Lentinus tigrinus ALCF2SS1-7]|uniref:Uncharacterized protein n=1 Tax=Lentinus tigrinus ALCF2SS1-6 TaxID=1328759 RepID=A0A5C2RV53_9APHY|nr:hypothetical protein L227DRAFT_579549 [Lentinus tigrinus ALCF2SS1-6]RPD72544.1 hypothetical protein L226DRAFT_537064 [Lentinus tigrinus ALCF2SS1-7]
MHTTARPTMKYLLFYRRRAAQGSNTLIACIPTEDAPVHAYCLRPMPMPYSMTLTGLGSTILAQYCRWNRSI